MTTATFVPMEEYLANTYEPDREYVDGALVERNVGERQHSFIQAALAAFLFNQRRPDVRFAVFTEQRLLLRLDAETTRYRIPDLCVMAPDYARTPVLTDAPVLVIEILSPADRMNDVLEKIGEYIRFGVSAIWIVDPPGRKLFIADRDGLHEVKDLRGSFVCAGQKFTVDLRQIFAELDEI